MRDCRFELTGRRPPTGSEQAPISRVAASRASRNFLSDSIVLAEGSLDISTLALPTPLISSRSNCVAVAAPLRRMLSATTSLPRPASSPRHMVGRRRSRARHDRHVGQQTESDIGAKRDVMDRLDVAVGDATAVDLAPHRKAFVFGKIAVEIRTRWKGGRSCMLTSLSVPSSQSQ